MIELKSPRAWRQRGRRKRNSSAGIVADRFPLCNLHGVRVVYTLPEGCPLGVPNPFDRVVEIQRRGWVQLADRATNDYRAGLTLLHIADVCIGCADRLLRYSHVHYLRGKVRRDD